MTVSITEIYRSYNGDRWELVCTADPERTFVRHIPNSSSGGRTIDTGYRCGRFSENKRPRPGVHCFAEAAGQHRVARVVSGESYARAHLTSRTG
jgi:hypothetical protein